MMVAGPVGYDGAVRPPCARNDDISCNGATLSVEPACNCACGGRICDGELAGSTRYLQAALPRAGTTCRNAQAGSVASRTPRPPGTTRARCRCTGVAASRFGTRGGSKCQGHCLNCPSDLSTRSIAVEVWFLMHDHGRAREHRSHGM
jgi:hypothetical protein